MAAAGAGPEQKGTTAHVDLDSLLQAAVKEPRYIRTEDGGSILALALHCLMVEHGFRVHAENKPEGSTLYTPGAEWNGKYANEWVFNFRRRGYASVFTLHCSLQAASGKMFVHAREADSPSNMRYMGLLVGRYMPDLARCRGSSWAGVVAEQQALKAQFDEYVITPLLESALPAPEGESVEEEGGSSSSVWARFAPFASLSASDAAIGVSVLLLAAAAGVALLYMRRRPPFA